MVRLSARGRRGAGDAGEQKRHRSCDRRRRGRLEVEIAETLNLRARGRSPWRCPVPLPTVTCVVTAYNHERFVVEAIESALHELAPRSCWTWSSSTTVDRWHRPAARRVLRRHRPRDGHPPGQPRLRRGDEPPAARSPGASSSRSSTATMAGRSTSSAAMPRAAGRAEVGLVHGDMAVVDVHGGVIHESFFAYSGFDVRRGRVLGRLIAQNFVSGGASASVVGSSTSCCRCRRSCLTRLVHRRGHRAIGPDRPRGRFGEPIPQHGPTWASGGTGRSSSRTCATSAHPALDARHARRLARAGAGRRGRDEDHAVAHRTRRP